jgi:hypothetical protein
MAPRIPLTPYFESSHAMGVADEAPRVLLISFHFPPSVAVGGVRWQSFARYIVERGWHLDVITLDPKTLATRDDSRLALLPSGVRAFGITPPPPSLAASPKRVWQMLRRIMPRREPYVRAGVARGNAVGVQAARNEVSRVPLGVRLSRAYFAWIDFVEGRRLARAVAALGRGLHAQHRYSAVISSGPPHMAHEAARLFARRARVPFVADFRDPWSMIERVPKDGSSPLWFALAERHEQRVIAEASLITMNTERSEAAMRAGYPAAASRIITVRNGADDDPLPAPGTRERFTIRFAGTAYLDRDPRLVFRASARVIRELGLTPAQFGLLFAGDFSEFEGDPIQQMATDEGVAEFVQVLPRLSRSDAMRFLADGTMLLNLPQDSDLAIPAKIYEYVRFEAWLLILAKEQSATAEVLRGTSADVVDPGDVGAIAAAIRGRYLAFATGERPQAANQDGRFDRRIQADRLLDRLAVIATPLPGGGP